MSRYIDADALLDIFKALKWYASYSIVHGMPTADVVEVVRCRDCRYRNKVFDFGRGDCMNPKGLKRIVYENNYCCHGKRREDERNI